MRIGPNVSVNDVPRLDNHSVKELGTYTKDLLPHYENGLQSPTDHPEVKKTLAGLTQKYAYRPDRATPLCLEEVGSDRRRF